MDVLCDKRMKKEFPTIGESTWKGNPEMNEFMKLIYFIQKGRKEFPMIGSSNPKTKSKINKFMKRMYFIQK